MSFISGIAERGATPALVATMSFSEAKLGVLAENIANIHTPGYRAKQLDAQSFQAALKDALEDRGRDYHQPLNVDNRGEVRSDGFGRISFHPTERPPESVLFHDGTDASIERQMAQLAETGMTYELSARFLRGNFDGLRKAIRGRAQ